MFAPFVNPQLFLVDLSQKIQQQNVQYVRVHTQFSTLSKSGPKSLIQKHIFMQEILHKNPRSGTNTDIQ